MIKKREKVLIKCDVYVTDRPLMVAVLLVFTCASGSFLVNMRCSFIGWLCQRLCVCMC